MGSSLAYPGIQDLIISTQQLWSSNKIAAAIAAAVDPTMKAPEAFAPAGTYPVTYGGAAVEKGDTFRITAPGTMGAITVNTEDLLIALIDTPAQVDANWMVAESNRDQATETVKGVAELATQAEADAGTNDTNIMTPLKTATAPVRAHDIDPGAGPHTGGLPEASSEFDDATGHAHTGAAGNGTVVAHSDTSGQTTDDHHAQLHASDHENGGGDEIDVGGLSGQLADNQNPTAHAAEHVDGTDDIQDATNSQKGVATAAQITLLEKLENMPINDQTGTSYTFVLADKDKNVRFNNAAAVTATVPPNSSVAYPIGAKLFSTQIGAGQVTFAPGSGVTLNGELSITDQWLAAGLIKVAINTWDVIGGTGSSAPEAHAASHENAGSDEIDVGGLSGELADDQPPKAHTLGGSAHSVDTFANVNTKVSDENLVAFAGQLGGSAAVPDIRGIRETGGPTLLTAGAIADGQFLKRSGATLVGDTPNGSENLDWIPLAEHALNGGAGQALFNNANMQGATFKVDKDVTFNRVVLHSGVSLSGTFTARVAIYQDTDGGVSTSWAKVFDGTFTNAVGANTTFEVADGGAGDVTLKKGVYAIVIGRVSGAGSPWIESFFTTNTSLLTNSLASATHPTIWNSVVSAASPPATVNPTTTTASTTTKVMVHRFKKV